MSDTEEKVTLTDVCPAIGDRYPNSMIGRYCRDNQNPDITLVKLELNKIVQGLEIDGDYSSEADKREAIQFLNLITNIENTK